MEKISLNTYERIKQWEQILFASLDGLEILAVSILPTILVIFLVCLGFLTFLLVSVFVWSSLR